MSQTEKQITGALGEELAASFLVANGYTVIGRNLHFSKNEIDIVAEDGDVIAFIEVKTRSVLYPESGDFGIPSRAVDAKKRNNLVSATRAYLAANPVSKQPRMDVIEVYLKESNSQFPTPQILKINHIRDAFDARGRKH